MGIILLRWNEHEALRGIKTKGVVLGVDDIFSWNEHEALRGIKTGVVVNPTATLLLLVGMSMKP